MEALVAQFPLRFSSLPVLARTPCHPISNGLTGGDSSTAAAMDWLKNELSRLGYHFEDQAPVKDENLAAAGTGRHGAGRAVSP